VWGNDHEKAFGYLGNHTLQKGLATILVLFFRMFKKCRLTPCWACKFKWHVTHLWLHMQVLYTYVAHHVYVFNYTYNAVVWCISNYTYMIMCIFLWAQVRSYIWNLYLISFFCVQIFRLAYIEDYLIHSFIKGLQYTIHIFVLLPLFMMF
jgi:hypothetical protein